MCLGNFQIHCAPKYTSVCVAVNNTLGPEIGETTQLTRGFLIWSLWPEQWVSLTKTTRPAEQFATHTLIPKNVIWTHWWFHIFHGSISIPCQFLFRSYKTKDNSVLVRGVEVHGFVTLKNWFDVISPRLNSSPQLLFNYEAQQNVNFPGS